jgi:hypothetical protein
MPTQTVFTIFFTSMSVLACLHVYWASLILKMAFKAVVEKGVNDDIRNVAVKDE